MTIMGILLLALSLSCRKADTNGESVGDTDAKDKIIRKQRLDECEALLAEARKVDKTDVGAAIAAHDKAWDALQDHKENIDPLKHAQMVSEVRKLHTALVEYKGLRDLMTSVDNARREAQETRDKALLITALKNAMGEPGVPKKLVDSWAAEIKAAQEEMDFAKVTKLLVAGKTDDAIDELTTFIGRYPDNQKAKVIKLGLEMKKAKTLARAEAFKLYDLGRWSEALEKLKVLRKQNRGDREIREKMQRCQYELEMVAFREAVKKGDYKAAVAAGERARMYNADAWETKIAPVLAEMKARQ